MSQLELSPGPRLRIGTWAGLALTGLILAVGLIGAGALLANGGPDQTLYYSTAAPPVDYPGPAPVALAVAEAPTRIPATSTPTTAPKPGEPEAVLARQERREEPARLTTPVATPRHRVPVARPASERSPQSATEAAFDPITEAKRAIAACQARYDRLKDYSCTFFKRERLQDGRLTSQHVMLMKARTRPSSVYFKFLRPNAGREAIWVQGRFGNQAVVHDVGLGKLLAGTLHLDPKSSMAMEDCRHPITEAGLGHLIREISSRWAAEMKHGETVVTIHRNTRVGDRLCTMIESRHPRQHPSYLFHKVKVYIDHEHNLPIRFEAYDWPRSPGAQSELVEEYSYVNLKLDNGLSDRDFDPKNRQYAFGRF